MYEIDIFQNINGFKLKYDFLFIGLSFSATGEWNITVENILQKTKIKVSIKVKLKTFVSKIATA